VRNLLLIGIALTALVIGASILYPLSQENTSDGSVFGYTRSESTTYVSWRSNHDTQLFITWNKDVSKLSAVWQYTDGMYSLYYPTTGADYVYLRLKTPTGYYDTSRYDDECCNIKGQAYGMRMYVNYDMDKSTYAKIDDDDQEWLNLMLRKIYIDGVNA